MVSILPSKQSHMKKEDFLEKRNKELYDLLSKEKVIIVPDERIVTIDRLPIFAFLEANIKRKNNEKVYKET